MFRAEALIVALTPGPLGPALAEGGLCWRQAPGAPQVTTCEQVLSAAARWLQA